MNKVFIYISLSFILNGVNAQTRRAVKCDGRQSRHLSAWMHQYRLSVNQWGYTTRPFHSSKLLLNNVDRTFDDVINQTKIHSYVEMLEVKKFGHLSRIRSFNAIVLWHYYHGHPVIFHQFNPMTRQYTRTELGYRTNIYSVVEQPNVWGAIEFLDNNRRSYAFLGATAINNHDASTVLYQNREKMLEDFPNQRQIIDNLFERETRVLPIRYP